MVGMTDNGNDIVIAGAGLAGAGLAAQLAAGGLRVDVLERTTEYPDRVRGEMYCPWGVAIADELGLLEPLLDAGAAFSTNWVFYDRRSRPTWPALGRLGPERAHH